MVYFSPAEVSYISQFISGRRKRFLKSFDRILTFKLQRLGVNCCLRCKSNYFSIKTSKKINIWSGRYFCSNENCSIKFEASIEKWPINNNNLICNIYWHGLIQHEKLNLPKSQCRGKERLEISYEVQALGTENLIVENAWKDLTDDDCN